MSVISPALLSVNTTLTAAQLNADEQSAVLDRARLRQSIEDAVPGLYDWISVERPHLLACAPVFVSVAQAKAMADIAQAVETVSRLPAYRAHVATWAPAAGKKEYAALGVFTGVDFHLDAVAGAQVIEVNTNAGGAALLAKQLFAQSEGEDAAIAASVRDVEQRFVDMFRQEWYLQRGDTPLRNIAIIDDAPKTQYLYADFLLFQQLFAAQGLSVNLAAPEQFYCANGRLCCDGQPVDLVYNRLTDFDFSRAEHAVLAEAWRDDLAVITPHPRAHALMADKRNLAVLGNEALLTEWGVDALTRQRLTSGIAQTTAVAAEQAHEIWQHRKHLFFKPVGGFASKGVYRGESITRKMFDVVCQESYVAQAYVAPPVRMAQVDGESVAFKFDVRAFIYAGQVQLLAARLWRGQAVNFRTAGSGFAPVIVVPQ